MPESLKAGSSANLLVSRALEDALTALTSEDITGPEKRLLLGTIVEKVIPHKEGADVFFAPGVFQKPRPKTARLQRKFFIFFTRPGSFVKYEDFFANFLLCPGRCEVEEASCEL